MGRIYTVTLQNQAITTAVDILEQALTASQVVRIRSAFIGQSSDAGDANAQMLRVVLRRHSGGFTSGSGGSTPTARPHDVTHGAYTGTIEMGNTTLAVNNAGTMTTLLEETFNVQAGWYYTPTPEELFEFNPSERILISIADTGEDFADATADSLANGVNISARVTFEVFGAL